MNGKRARSLRYIAADGESYDARKDHLSYQSLKRALKADQGQHPKPLAERSHKMLEPIKPTWPRTKDQKAQSRPLIVVRPVRAYLIATKGKYMPKEMLLGLPKHRLDALASLFP